MTDAPERARPWLLVLAHVAAASVSVIAAAHALGREPAGPRLARAPPPPGWASWPPTPPLASTIDRSSSSELLEVRRFPPPWSEVRVERRGSDYKGQFVPDYRRPPELCGGETCAPLEGTSAAPGESLGERLRLYGEGETACVIADGDQPIAAFRRSAAAPSAPAGAAGLFISVGLTVLSIVCLLYAIGRLAQPHRPARQWRSASLWIAGLAALANAALSLLLLLKG